jgi:hypothetical protein
MVGAELGLKSVLCGGARGGNGHHTRVADQNIDGFVGGFSEEFCCCAAHACQGVEVHV